MQSRSARARRAGATIALFGMLVAAPAAGEHAIALPSVDANPPESASVEANAPRGLAFALRAALARNPSAKSGRAQLDVREGDVWAAKAARLPNVNGRIGSDDTEFDRGVVSVAQPLFAFGRIQNGIRKAESALDAEAWALRKTQRVLIEETAMAYARVQGIRERSVVANENVAEHERLYERIERRRSGQLASDTDVALAFSRLIQARAQLASLEGERAVARAELAALTQMEIDTSPDVDPRHAELPDRESIEALALERSAALRERELSLDVLRHDVSLQRVSSLPTLSARVEQNFGDRISGSDSTRIGIVFEGNMEGAGFVSIGRYQGAAARLRAAEHDLDGARTEVLRQTRTMIANRDLQAGLVESQRQAVEAAQTTKQSFERQFESGHKTWLELLNIQRELAEVGTRLAQAENEWLSLSLRIAASIGRLDALAALESQETL